MIKNVFVSHYHADSENIEGMNKLLKDRGMDVRDSSIYENKDKNNANNPEYIKSLIRPQMIWAGTTVVLIGKETSKSDWVNWEIKYAAENDKRIVGVYLRGESDSELPQAFKEYGDSLVNWNSLKIYDAINGTDYWEGPKRDPWNINRGTCY